MRANDAFPGTYLKCDDLQGKRARCVIENVTMEKMGDDHKPVVHFQGTDKLLVLNKTNFMTIVDVTGEADTDDWPGAAIVLMPATTDFQGKRVKCIRIDPSHAAWPADRTKSGMSPVGEMARAEASKLDSQHETESEVAELTAEDIPF